MERLLLSEVYDSREKVMAASRRGQAKAFAALRGIADSEGAELQRHL